MDIKNPAIAGLCGLFFAVSPAFAEPAAEDCGPAPLAQLSDEGANDASIPVAETIPMSGSCDLPEQPKASPFGFTRGPKPAIIPAAPTPAPAPAFVAAEPEPQPEPYTAPSDPFAGAIEVGTISYDSDPEPAPVVRREAPRPVVVEAKPRPRYVAPKPRPKTTTRRYSKPKHKPKYSKPKYTKPKATAQRRLTQRRFSANPPIIDKDCILQGGCKHPKVIVIMEAAPIETTRSGYRTTAGENLTLSDINHRSNPAVRDMSCPANPRTIVVMRAQ